MTIDYIVKYLENIVDLYENDHPITLNSSDIRVIRTAIDALKWQEELEDDGK